MSVEGHGDVRTAAAFSRRLRAFRRQRGMTQRQLAAVVGYDHSMVSRWERGTREPPPAATVLRLDVALDTGGQLADALVRGQLPPGGPPHPSPSAHAPAHPSRTAASATAHSPTTASPLPFPLPRPPLLPAPPARAAEAYGGPLSASALARWPERLPLRELNCPLHGSAAHCPVPDFATVHALFDGVRGFGRSGAPFPDGSDEDVLHGLTALLECLVVENRTDLASDDTAHVERVLRALTGWAEHLHAAGRAPRGQLVLGAHYAVLAGRLRRQNGQNAAAMAWFGHGARWAEAGEDVSARAELLGEMSTLARAEHDLGSALSYAQALGALRPDRGWTAVLSHIFQARAYARAADPYETRRHLTLAGRRLDRLDGRDVAESPCLEGAQGTLHLDSNTGASLRDLAVSTGDRRAARRAVAATGSALGQLPQWMRPIRLLLTVRLADGHACAGDHDAAWETAAPVLRSAALSPRTVIAEELRGLSRRLVRT